VWQEIEKTRVTPYYDMKVWDSLGPSSIHFTHKEFSLPELGFIIENNIIQAALLQYLRRNFSNITLLTQRTVASVEGIVAQETALNRSLSEKVEPMSDWLTVKTTTGETFRTRLLVRFQYS
jgi:2-octaprenylphenol hydroxylase